MYFFSVKFPSNPCSPEEFGKLAAKDHICIDWKHIHLCLTLTEVLTVAGKCSYIKFSQVLMCFEL